VLRRWGFGAALPVGVLMLIGAALSIALAALAFYAVEKPAIDLGHRLTRRSRAPQPVAAC
jgi:peptidoglycan/LPS O-acetylase OafA/YrhL